MRPAFASTGHAAAVGLLLLVLMLLPVLVGKSCLPPREQVYSWMGWETSGAHPYNHHLIFEEKGDIDIAFMGSSKAEFDIDTPLVEEKLSALLGRTATVRTLAWGGGGFDELYFVAKDLLQNRKVKMIVFYNEYRYDNEPNSLAPYVFRYADDADILTTLPLRKKLAYYYAAILGMPKNLLGKFRFALPAELHPKTSLIMEHFQTGDVVNRLGSFASRLGFNYSTIFDDYGTFIPYTPKTAVKPSDVSIYSPETRDQFQFSGPPIPDWQLQFAKRFAALARQHSVKLVLLHFPLPDEMRSARINEPVFWPDVLRTDVSMIGIPPATLFEGLKDDEVRKLYKDNLHLNENGQKYFTPLITPALLKIYAESNH